MTAPGTPTAAPAISRVATARRRLARIRDALVVADGLLSEAYAARDWEALGYPAGAAGWRAYCAAELPALQLLRLRAPDRDARARSMIAAGLSVRATADALGAGLATIQRATADVARPDTFTALDGRTRRARAGASVGKGAPAVLPTCTVADQTVAHVTAAGPAGLTAAELCALTGWHHGKASGALSRVTKQARLRYLGGQQSRAGFGLYVAP